jgi:hypothetical protein
VSRFRFDSEHRGAFGVKRLCRVLEVSRSGFYAWECRPPSAGAVRDAELGGLIVEVHQRSRRTYGAPRVHAELRHLDQRCSRKRVARLMRDAGLVWPAPAGAGGAVVPMSPRHRTWSTGGSIRLARIGCGRRM